MKKHEITGINEMRLQGKSASEIAWKLGISVHTVRSHIRRHPDLVGGNPCKNCGKSIMAVPGRKEKLFCSDKCRMAWWNSHREQVRKKTFYTIVCAYCGKEFESYGKHDLITAIMPDKINVIICIRHLLGGCNQNILNLLGCSNGQLIAILGKLQFACVGKTEIGENTIGIRDSC